jgi:hypothetical protein
MSSLPGYTVLKKASQTLAERNDTAIDRFEVVDMKNMSKTELIVGDNDQPKTNAKPKRKNRQAKEYQNVDSSNNLNESNENNIVEIKQYSPEPKIDLKEVLFITPYTEITIDCLEYFIDENIFSVITKSNDRVKVRPERGAKLSVVVEDTKYDIYSSGLYIPIKNLDSILSIFFIMDENIEP